MRTRLLSLSVAVLLLSAYLRADVTVVTTDAEIRAAIQVNNANIQLGADINRDNRYTSAVLLRLGFHWSAPDSAYVNRMLTAISQLGFFDN